jgi:hypothetical protein
MSNGYGTLRQAPAGAGAALPTKKCSTREPPEPVTRRTISGTCLQGTPQS